MSNAGLAIDSRSTGVVRNPKRCSVDSPASLSWPSSSATSNVTDPSPQSRLLPRSCSMVCHWRPSFCSRAPVPPAARALSHSHSHSHSAPAPPFDPPCACLAQDSKKPKSRAGGSPAGGPKTALALWAVPEKFLEQRFLPSAKNSWFPWGIFGSSIFGSIRIPPFRAKADRQIEGREG